MMTRLALLWLLILTGLTGFAGERGDALWQKGNDCYNRKTFDSAVYYYEQIANQHPHNSELFYNLGNAYYRLNKIAPAVLNYERALKIEPGMTDANENLQLTQNRIRNHIQDAGEIFFLKWWNSMTHPSKSGTWAVTAMIIFLLIIAALAMRRFMKLSFEVPVQVAWILGLLWVWFMTLAVTAASRSCAHTDAVVMQNETPLLNTAMQGKSITQLPEGTTIAIIDEKENWLQVRIPDGRVGWLQSDQIEKI